MDLIELVFNTPLPYFGFRVVSLISYCVWFLMFFLYSRRVPGLSKTKRVGFSLWFMVIQIMISDWIWTFLSHLRWRSYIPPTNEIPWLNFQPWPFGVYFMDYFRWWAYITGFMIAAINLAPFFKEGWFSVKRAWLGHGLFALFEGVTIFLAPNPLWVDIGLWRLWPLMAVQVGPQVHVYTYILNDVLGRFVFVTLAGLSWLTWKKS